MSGLKIVSRSPFSDCPCETCSLRLKMLSLVSARGGAWVGWSGARIKRSSTFPHAPCVTSSRWLALIKQGLGQASQLLCPRERARENPSKYSDICFVTLKFCWVMSWNFQDCRVCLKAAYVEKSQTESALRFHSSLQTPAESLCSIIRTVNNASCSCPCQNVVWWQHIQAENTSARPLALSLRASQTPTLTNSGNNARLPLALQAASKLQLLRRWGTCRPVTFCLTHWQ